MKYMSHYRAHMFFLCAILTTNFVYGFRVKNISSDKLLLTVRFSTRRVNVSLEPGQLSKELDNDADSISLNGNTRIQVADLVNAKGSKIELTDETLLYALKKENVPTITTTPPFSDTPAAPNLLKTPSAPAGSGSDAGDSKKAAESETTQSTGGSTISHTITPVQT